MNSMNLQYEPCPITDIKQNVTGLGEWKWVIFWNDLYHYIPEDECTKFPKCKRSIYKMDIRTKGKVNQNSIQSVLKINFESSIVQKIVDYYAYDFASILGEVGGILGLFMGISLYSFVEYFEYVIDKLIKLYFK